MDKAPATIQEPDADLVRRTREGDAVAFETLMERHAPAVLNFISRRINRPSAAEDIAQAVFVRTYRAITEGTFDPARASIVTWLYRVARNAATDHLRQSRRNPLHTGMDAALDAAVSAQRNAREQLGDREIGEHIAKAVTALPEKQQTALILAEYHGLSHAEIADVMQCSQKSVETRIYRARQELRTALAHLL